MQRIYKWDNAKFALIFLVVLGHMASYFIDYFGSYKGIFMFAYSFHMVGFIFISGLLGKKSVNADKLSAKKLAPYLVLCVILNFFRYFVRFVFNRKAQFHIFELDGIPWFLFLLFVYIVFTHLIRKCDKRAVLIFSVIIACIAGYDKDVGGFLSLSRIFVYYPFYYLGYCLEEKKVRAFLNKTPVRIVSAVILIIFAVVCVTNFGNFYRVRKLVTGLNPYSAFLENDIAWGGLLRLVYYPVAGIIAAAFLSLIPDRKLPVISSMGAQTLSVYFWHLPIIHILFETGVIAMYVPLGASVKLIITVVISVGLTMLLSLPPFTTVVGFVMKPTKYFKKNKNM